MNDTPSAPVPPAPGPRSGDSYKFTFLLAAGLLAAGAAYYFYTRSNDEPKPVDEFVVLKPFFAGLGKGGKLAPEYADTDPVDLIADTPKDPAAMLAVEEIGFTVVGTDDETRLKAEQEEWKDLMAALEKATGKKVVYRTDIPSPTAQMEALRAGKLHVTAFNTGAVPLAVNSSGFVPLFAPADAEGKFAYQMQILVKAASPIRKPEDLKGKKVGFVALSSNSGAKAPIQVLHDKFQLLPGRDYSFSFIGDHYASIGELVHGTEFDAVCVASDLKARAVSSGRVKFHAAEKELEAEMFREIYTSESFPPLCFGIPHNLPAPMRSAIEGAFRSYRFADTSAKKYVQQGKVQFAPVNYEKDWKLVREIDAALGKLADLP